MPSQILIALLTATAPANMAPTLPISSATMQAVAMCERAVQADGNIALDMPKGTELFHDLLGRAKGAGIHMTADAPPLIQRFVMTQPWRAVEPPSFMIRYPSGSGEAWAIVAGRTRSCNVVVTGSTDPSASNILGKMQPAGWRMIITRPASQPGMLASHTLVKMNPTPSAPNWGVRAIVRSLGFTPDTRDGVQMEMSFIAGDIVVKPSP